MKFYTKAAGFFSIGFRIFKKEITIHFLMKKEYWKYWWRHNWYYDGPIYLFGLGPLLLISWGDYWDSEYDD